MFKKLNNKQGFTLTEIIIVVSIVLCVLVISIFFLSRGRINANNIAAKGGVEAITAALEAYKTSHVAYTGSLNDLTEDEVPYLSDSFSDGNNQGYDYIILTSGTNRYLVFAQPEIDGVTGSKFVISDQGSIVEFDDYDSAFEYIDDAGFDTGELPEPGLGGGPPHGSPMGP